jgi:hypothetical protein
MSVGCDVQLKFKDGTMPASSVALRMMSRVFSNALDSQKHKTPPKASRSASHSSPPGKTFVTMKGVSKEQWLRIAEFLYPVVPSPKIKDWADAEYLLEVGIVRYFCYLPGTVCFVHIAQLVTAATTGMIRCYMQLAVQYTACTSSGALGMCAAHS